MTPYWLNLLLRRSIASKSTNLWLLICCVGALSTFSFMYYSPSSDETLQRHVRAIKPMIDMRGFPDTEGLCLYAGFFRNKTDCTQFYRCVDFNRNGKHTVFRFMCGPMTVFDPSRSLCTGPEMAVPSCPTDQLPNMNMTMNFTTSSTTERSSTKKTTPFSTTYSSTTETTTTSKEMSTDKITTSSFNITPSTSTGSSTTMESTTTPSISSESTSTTTTGGIHPCPTTETVATPNSTSIKEEWKLTASFTGILQIGDTMFLNSQHQSSVTENRPIYPNTTNALFVSAEIKITEEDGTSIKQTAVSIPTGGILGIVTMTNEGEITGISNGYFTTNSTRLIFPFGIRLGTILIRDDGTMSLHNPIDTGVRTTISVPTGSIFGQLNLSSQGVVTGIGNASFSTQHLLTHYSTSQVPEILTAKFGVIYFNEQFNLSQSIVISSTEVPVSNQLQTISAIIQIAPLGYTKTKFNTTKLLSISSGSSFVIIPQNAETSDSKGREIVTVTEDGTTVSTYTVLPGQIFGFLDVQDAKVTNLGDGFFTTNTTTMSFGSGTMYGIIEVGLDGSILTSELNKTLNGLSVTVTQGSTVGKIRFINNDERQIIRSIGGAPFVIRNLTSSADQTRANGAVGLLGIDDYLSRVTTTSTELFALNCKSDRPQRFPLNCSRFYQCVTDGDKRDIYVFSCVSGLYFDDVSSECRTPAETACKDQITISDTIVSSPQETGGIIRLDCNGIFFRYPINCNTYYTCSKDDEERDTINVFSCAVGLIFDESSSSCLLPSETLSCDVNASVDEQLLGSPSIVSQLREKIDVNSYISKAKDFSVEQKTNLSKFSDVIIPVLPTGRGATQSKMRIRMSANIQTPISDAAV